MNQSRILRVTNVLLLLSGYQLHWFVAKSQRFRLTLPALLYLVVLCSIYIACFTQHFEKSALLEMLQDLSPFLYGLVRLQLLLGIKVLVYAVYASVCAIGAANGLLEQLEPLVASTRTRAIAKPEWAAYGLLLSTWCVLLGFGFYIGYEMKFKLPPLEDIMIGLALFMPHFMLGGALRFYNIFAWLCRGQLQRLAAHIDEELSDSSAKEKNATELMAAATSLGISVTAAVQTDALGQQKQQLELLATRLSEFFAAMKGSMLLLFGMHTNCLLAGIYSYVYYSQIWQVMFEPRKRRIFYASNLLIYACIGCDYICLLMTQTLLQQQCTKLWNRLGLALSQRDLLPKKMRSIIKDMRGVLTNVFSFRFSSLWRFDVAHFTLIKIIEGLIIALTVLYHYFNDAIVQINERLDSNNDE